MKKLFSLCIILIGLAFFSCQQDELQPPITTDSGFDTESEFEGKSYSEQLRANGHELTTFTRSVSQGTDDVSENTGGNMVIDGKFLWLAGSSTGKLRAIRFEDVIIPEKAVILDAYIEFYGYGNGPAGKANISIEQGNPLTYSSDLKSISSRQYLVRKAIWERTTSVSSMQVIRTSNLNNIIDENRSLGWKSGQALAFSFDGLSTNQGLCIYSYEGNTNYSPKLVVKYYIDENFRHSQISESIVTSYTDDASESFTGLMTRDGAYLWLGGATSGNTRAIRFKNIEIPATASIIDAYIEFFTYTDSPTSMANIYAELGNPDTYSTFSKNISSRKYTATRVRWDESAANAIEVLRTPNLQTIIDENRTKGWVSGQNLAFKFQGLDINNGTTVFAHDGGATCRPKLVVKYINDGKGPQTPIMPKTIVCIGNSITVGYGLVYSDIHSYPAQLERDLGIGYKVTNLGVNGASMQKKSDITYWNTTSYSIAKASNPDIFIIGLGANDGKPVNWNSSSPNIYKQDYKDMIRELQNSAIGKNPKFYIAIPCYVDPTIYGTTKHISGKLIQNEVAPAARELAAELGLEIIDFNAVTYERTYLYWDRVHPNRHGAAELAKHAAEVIRKGASNN